MLILRIGPSLPTSKVSNHASNPSIVFDAPSHLVDPDLLHHTESSKGNPTIGRYDIFIAPQLPAPTTTKLAHVKLGDDRSIIVTLREWTSCKCIDRLPS